MSLFKTCTYCNTSKKIEHFHKLKKGLLGRNSVCKDCRKHKRIIKNNECLESKVKLYLCNICNKRKNYKFFYKNKSSTNGLQSYCKKCQKIKIAESKSKLINFSKIILKKFKKKKKNKNINLTFNDIIRKFNQQEGKCFFTNHKMTHISDLKQRTDNIWNISIYISENNKKKDINYEDFQLTIHLIYTLTEMYRLKDNEIMKVYQDLANNKII